MHVIQSCCSPNHSTFYYPEKTDTSTKSLLKKIFILVEFTKCTSDNFRLVQHCAVCWVQGVGCRTLGQCQLYSAGDWIGPAPQLRITQSQWKICKSQFEKFPSALNFRVTNLPCKVFVTNTSRTIGPTTPHMLKYSMTIGPSLSL